MRQRERVREIDDPAALRALDALDPPRPGRIDVMLLDDGAVAVVEVADDGPGFPPEILGSAFERFVRGDEARTRGRTGAGLGLSIARSYAEAVGGALAYEDAAPRGARFTFTLPAA